MPHPLGTIHVQYRHDHDRADFEISLPHGLPGYLLWYGVRHSLQEGTQTLHLAIDAAARSPLQPPARPERPPR